MSDSIYDDNALIAKNKVQMVNICLNAIGEVPLDSGTILADLQPGTDGAIARDLISKTMIEVQNEGYYFNIDLAFEFVPDQDGFIAVPANLLRIDPGNTNNRSKIIFKNGRFYNLDSQDFIFTENLKADAVWIVDYEELPFSAWNYIAYKSAVLFERATIASPDLGRIASINEQSSKLVLDKEHMKYRDYNLLGAISSRTFNPNWANR